MPDALGEEYTFNDPHPPMKKRDLPSRLGIQLPGKDKHPSTRSRKKILEKGETLLGVDKKVAKEEAARLQIGVSGNG
jgi:hypothetical protein